LDALATQPGTRIDAGLAIGMAALADPNRPRAVAPVLVLLTDGRPTPGTRQAAVDAAAAARAEGITLFAIGLGSDVDAGLLAELAGDARRAFLAPDAATLRAVYDALAGEVLCE
jgi:Mg-chelatase subunit ChlD